MDLKQSTEKRFALLIDADNVSAKYIKPILDELSKYGTVTYKRIYGDWTLALHAKWKDALLENSITPIQQFGYTQGKNATDSAMIIDAMDILYTHSVDGFCIVSSDSDFTRLAARIRESGLTVIGMGEKKTPTPFRKACDIFTTLELLVGEQGGRGRTKGLPATSGSSGQAASKDEIEQAVVDIITDNQNNGKATGLGEVGSRLLKRYPDFDVRSYGTNLLSKLLGEFSRVKITKDGSSVAVDLVDERGHEQENAHISKKGQGAAAFSEAAFGADESQGAEPDAQAESGVRVESGAHAESGAQAESGAHAESGARVELPARAKRRTPRRRHASASSAQAAAKENELLKLQKGDETSKAVETEGARQNANTEKADQSPRASRESKASKSEKAKQPSTDVPSAKAPQILQASKAAESEKTRRPKRSERATGDSQASKAQRSSETPEALQASKRAQVPAASKTPQTPQVVQTQQTQQAAQTPQALIRQTIVDAGSAGVSLSSLNKRVRSRFQNFKVRDLGYSQLKSYVAHFGDVEFEKVGKETFVRLEE